MFNNYPYTDFHELNLSWVIEQVQKLNESIDSLIDINTIKYADPIEWNIAKQYEKNTIVINNYNTYLSKLPVPAGIPIDNGDYWLLIGNFQRALEEVQTHLTELDNRVDSVDSDILELKERDVHIENMIADTWSNTITYAVGSYVTYLDSMYKCKIQNIGIVPTNTTYWEVVTIDYELVRILDTIKNVNSLANHLYSGVQIKLSSAIANGGYINFILPMNCNPRTVNIINMSITNRAFITDYTIESLANGCLSVHSNQASAYVGEPSEMLCTLVF